MKTIRTVLAGTGFDGRAARIRSFCREGANVDLRREPRNPHDPESIGVWMECRILFGLWKPWVQIGYVKAARADRLAPRLDSGEYLLIGASVANFSAPPGRDHPRVSFDIRVRRRSPAMQSAPPPSR